MTPLTGYVWISCSRQEFDSRLGEIQGVLQALCGMQLVDLHISDLLNRQLQSRYDCTARYDLPVFRRLAAGHSTDKTQSAYVTLTPPSRSPPWPSSAWRS
jgi:magnesium transporter